MIRVDQLSKRYGSFQAIEDVSFTVDPGIVVGFLGRNGAGKSTTMRILAGLSRPSAGTATIDGKPYSKLSKPMRAAGFGLDAEAFHPAISGRRALSVLAARGGIGHRRVAEVLELVELEAAADRAVGRYSLGMRQRLLLACAMLGDPPVIVLDEPTNGLDPQGHRWLREFLRARAGEGRAILLSSHVLGDVAETVDRAVVISRGRVVADAPLGELAADGGEVRVASPQPDRLGAALRDAGATVVSTDGEALRVTGLDCAAIGDLAAGRGIPLHELTAQRGSLEGAFFALTTGEEEGLR